MPDDSDSKLPAKFGLNKKIGPLPLWGYAVIIGGVGFVYLYLRKRAGGSAGTSGSYATPIAGAGNSGTFGAGGSGSGGGGGASGGTPTPTPTPTPKPTPTPAPTPTPTPAQTIWYWLYDTAGKFTSTTSVGRGQTGFSTSVNKAPIFGPIPVGSAQTAGTTFIDNRYKWYWDASTRVWKSIADYANAPTGAMTAATDSTAQPTWTGPASDAMQVDTVRVPNLPGTTNGGSFPPPGSHPSVPAPDSPSAWSRFVNGLSGTWFAGSSPGFRASDLSGYTSWAPNADGTWSEWAPGDYIPQGTQVGVLPNGTSLDNGRNAWPGGHFQANPTYGDPREARLINVN